MDTLRTFHPGRRRPLANFVQPVLLTLLALGLCAVVGPRALAQQAKAIKREHIRDVMLVREEAAKVTPYLSVNIDGHSAPIRTLAFTPDSMRLCSAGMDKVVHVWSLPGVLDAAPKAIIRQRDMWRRERTIRWEIARGLRGTINAISIAPKSGELAMAGFGARGSAGEVVWVDPIDGSLLRSAYADDGTHRDSVVSLAHSSDGRWLVSADIFGRVLLWRQGEKNPHEVHPSDGRNVAVRPVSIVGNSHVVVPHFAGEQAVGGGRKVPTWKVQYYNLAGRRVETTFKTVHYVSITALAGSPDGRWFASSDQARKIYIYQKNDLGRWIRHATLEGHVANSLSFSADGRRLAVGTMGEPGRSKPEVRVYDTATKRLLWSKEMQRSVVATAISPDGRFLAYTGSDEHDIHLRRLDRLEGEFETVIAGGARLKNVSLASRPGTYQAVFKSTSGLGEDGLVFDPANLSLEGGRAVAAVATFSTATLGGWRGTVSADRTTLQLAKNGVRRGRVKVEWSYQGSIRCHTFIADAGGKPIAVAIGTDTHNGVYVYSLAETGDCKLLRYFRGHNDQVTSLGVSRDQKYLTSSSADGTVRYWKLENLTADLAVPRRWGAQVALTEDRANLIVRDVVDSGPLHHKGVRDGDIITKIYWTERGEDGDPIVFSTKDPREIYGKLQTLKWHKQVTFETRRGRLEQPKFNLVGGWNHFLAVFVDGRDWIAWHPSGYYTCSPGGERLIGWQLNNDLGLKPSYFEAMRFAKTLHQPDMISELLSQGSISAAALKVGLDRQAAIADPDDVPERPLDLEEILISTPTEIRPPTVTIVTPRIAPGEHAKSVPGGRVKIVAVAESTIDVPITSMQLLLNGRPFMPKQGAKGADRELVEKLATWEVDLPPGENTLRVLADTKLSQGTSDEVVIKVLGAPDKPKLHILAMGISDYPRVEHRLRYGRSDAESLAATLAAGAGELYDVQEPVIISDRDATKANIVAGMEAVSKKVGPKDLTILFYSGHGIRDNDEFHLFCADGNPDNIRGSCVSEKAIKKFAAETPGTLIMMVDACHSGAFRVDKLVRDLARDDYAVIVMASSQGEEVSYEKEEWGAGAFTKAAREGLLGQADQNGDTYVLNIEIVPYIYNRVTELTDDAQNPVYTLPPIKPFRLARVNEAAE